MMLRLSVDGMTNDALNNKIRRALVGALYGLLAGTAFVFISSFVDRWLYPDLPLGLDWQSIITRWLLLAFGLGLIGFVTSWPGETWAGLIAGTVVAGSLALIVSLFSAKVDTGLKLIVLIFTLMPIAVISLPIAWFMRWLVERHEQSLHLKRAALRIALLIGAVIVLGAAAGYFAKMSPRAVQAARSMDMTLQTIAANPNSPIYDLPGLQEHAGKRYKLFQKSSEFSTEGFDVRAEYEDGYTVQCVIVLYPGRDPFLTGCVAK